MISFTCGNPLFQKIYRDSFYQQDQPDPNPLITGTLENKSAEGTSAEATKPEGTAVTSTEPDTISSSFPSFGTLFFGFIFVGALAGIFVYLGGLHYVRRVLSGGKRERYQKLGGQDDLEGKDVFSLFLLAV